jgi:hypothetical protein
MHRVILFGLSALAICLPLPTGVQAGSIPIGTQGFADIGRPTANGSPTGDIDTATTFMLGTVASTASQSGIFDGMPTEIIGPIPFDISVPTGFTFTNPVFGTLTSISITSKNPAA